MGRKRKEKYQQLPKDDYRGGLKWPLLSPVLFFPSPSSPKHVLNVVFIYMNNEACKSSVLFDWHGYDSVVIPSICKNISDNFLMILSAVED